VACGSGGCGCGLALMGVVIVRARQEKAGWLVVTPPAVLFAGFLITGRQLFPVISDGSVITTDFEAGVFGLCALLYCALMIVCLARLPEAWRRGAVMRHRLQEQRACARKHAS
jgi:hypothetical protein